jgi:chemotaxis signal transduction protein
MSEVPVTDDRSRLATRAAALRSRFDLSFAEPAQFDMTPMVDLLAVRVGDDVFAIRLSEIMGLYVGKKVTRVPGGDAALIGIAGFRGTIHPVYGFATLLGRPVEVSPRWLVIAAAAPVALAFDGFERHLRVASDTIRPRDVNAEDHPYARDFAPVLQVVRPILHLPSILDAIRAQRPAVVPGKAL